MKSFVCISRLLNLETNAWSIFSNLFTVPLDTSQCRNWFAFRSLFFCEVHHLKYHFLIFRISGSHDKTICLFDRNTWEVEKKLIGHKGFIDITFLRTFFFLIWWLRKIFQKTSKIKNFLNPKCLPVKISACYVYIMLTITLQGFKALLFNNLFYVCLSWVHNMPNDLLCTLLSADLIFPNKTKSKWNYASQKKSLKKLLFSW